MISGKALSIAHAQIGAQSLPLSNLADYVEHRLVRLAGLWVEARDGVSELAAVECGGLVDLAREEAFAQRAKASRKLLGRKQKDFCERCGVERSYFDGVERGKRNLTFSNLCRICDGLNCDIAAVTEGIPHPKDAPKLSNMTSIR